MNEARSKATTTDATPDPGQRPWPGDDFASWLPPMLVRELRQGIQSGAFFSTFLVLQLALVLHAAMTVLGLHAAGLSTAGEFTEVVIFQSGNWLWVILVVILGAVLPLRGLTAIAAERTGNNLDLVRLTRLSATRIVVGKWAAIVVQVLLVTAAGLLGRGGDFPARVAMLGLPVLLLMVRALTERPVRFRRLHASFGRHGVAGRLTAAVLTPGWATGLVFVALAGGLVVARFLSWAGPGRWFVIGMTMSAAQARTFMASCVSLTAAAIVFPLPLLLLVPRLQARATLYVTVQGICFVVFLVDAWCRSTLDGRAWASGPQAIVWGFPLAALARVITAQDPGAAASTGPLVAGLVALAVILALVARPWWLEMRHTQRLVSGEAPP